MAPNYFELRLAEKADRLEKALQEILQECDEAPTDNNAWVVAIQQIARTALTSG